MCELGAASIGLWAPTSNLVEAPISNRNLSSGLPRVTEAHPGSPGQREGMSRKKPCRRCDSGREVLGWSGTRLAVTLSRCHPFSVQGIVVQVLGPGSVLNTLFGPASGLFDWRHLKATLRTVGSVLKVPRGPSLPVEGGVFLGADQDITNRDRLRGPTLARTQELGKISAKRDRRSESPSWRALFEVLRRARPTCGFTNAGQTGTEQLCWATTMPCVSILKKQHLIVWSWASEMPYHSFPEPRRVL